MYVGLVAAAAVLGAGLPFSALQGKPILQLGAGIAIVFFAGLVPVLGTLVVVIITAIGFGAVILTRFKATNV